MIAPEYEDGALEALRAKPAIRILRDRSGGAATSASGTTSASSAACSSRTGTARSTTSGMELVCGEASEAVWGDLLFAWRSRQARGLERDRARQDLQTLGIGGGQTSRVDPLGSRSRRRGSTATTSTAQYWPRRVHPFADGPQVALEAGVTAIIQPGGAKRDEEVVAAVEAAGGAMVFTGRRHFRH